MDQPLASSTTSIPSISTTSTVTTNAPRPLVTDQAWSFLYLLTGCVMILACKHFGVSDEVGAGIVGAGIQAFTAQQKSYAVQSPNKP